MSEQRTEKATPKRLQKAREDGQFPAAKDFVSAMQYLGVLLILRPGEQPGSADAQHDFRRLLAGASRCNSMRPAGAAGQTMALAQAFLPLGMGAAALLGITLAGATRVNESGRELQTPCAKRRTIQSAEPAERTSQAEPAGCVAGARR